MKYTRYRDIPQFVRDGNWECNFDLDSVWDWINRKGDQGIPINLDPSFQRAHVWTQTQQIEWLEFFFRGGKTGRVIYFNCPCWQSWREYKKNEYNEMVIVDGKQRLEAIRRFLNNEIKVFDSFYHEYTDKLRAIQHTIRINVNTLQTEKEVIQWYLQMNSGGTPHTSAEIERVKNLLEQAQ